MITYAITDLLKAHNDDERLFFQMLKENDDIGSGWSNFFKYQATKNDYGIGNAGLHICIWDADFYICDGYRYEANITVKWRDTQ